jgi:hypothetical protein
MELHRLLDSLPGELLQMPVRRSHLQRVDQSVRVLRTTVGPSQALSEVHDEMRSASTEPQPQVPVHGDFYDGQLLVQHGRISAVIDVDTAGRGERADEWATLLAHLSVFGLTNPRARSYGSEVLAVAERHVDDGDLRLRTAAVVLGLATGPFRTQQPGWTERTAARIGVAHQWLSSMRNNSSSTPATLMSARDS